MTLALSDIVQWLGGVAIAVAGWLWKELASLRGDHSNHRTHVAERYVTKDDMKETLNRVYESLARIEKKLDNP